MKSANALAAAALAAVLALPIAVHAQPASTPAPGTAAAPPAHATATPGPASPLSPAPAAGATAAERVEAHIRQLHDQLQITPAAKVQWDKFAAVMRANARAMDRDFAEREQKFATMNAVENMRSYERIAEAHADHLRKLVPAFAALYDVMPAQQKRLTDQVFRENAQARAAAHAQTTGSDTGH